MSTTRLYLGNLSATVDEYSLIQLCAKWGKVSKLDYLYHKTGIQRGKPRGFAFVEFSTAEVSGINCVDSPPAHKFQLFLGSDSCN